MQAAHAAAVEQFMAIASCDREFAASFLEANAWSLESAVNNFMEPGAASAALPAAMGGASPAGASSLGDNPAMGGAAFDALGGAFMDEEPRAPIAQFRDTLIGQDPAQRAPPAKAASNHPLEAFRSAAGGSGAAESSESGGSSGTKEVFGLPKRPRNLAEIYAAPTELCFTGNFDELRAAGRREQKWLLINIQSPQEFASQQLNADTWRDETLRAVISASFLFWQQYYDSPEGSTYCRFYLKDAVGPSPVGLPHIAVVDPVTASAVKTWTGFKDAERLMDKLMEYADEPPTDLLATLSPSAMAPVSQQLSPPRPQPHPPGIGHEPLPPVGASASGYRSLGGAGMPSHFQQPQFGEGSGAPGGGGGDSIEEAELAAAIAASLAGGGDDMASGFGHTTPPVPQISDGPTASDIDEQWGPASAEPADGIPLKIRLADGSQFIRKFSPSQTFNEVLVAVHASGHRLDPTKRYKLSMQFGVSVTERATSLEAAGVQRGAYMLSEC